MRTHTLLAAAAAVGLGLSAPISASAQDFVITTGSDAGTYFNEFGPRIKKALETRRFPHEVVTSKGTGENFQRVCDNPHNVAVGQADVLPRLISENPQCPPVKIIKEVASECVVGATSVTNLENLDQVAQISFNLRVAIPGKGSGSWLTWENLVSLNPLLQDAEVIEVENSAAGVEMVQQGRADIVMFVAFPNPDNQVFGAINKAGLDFIDMSNFDMLQQQAGGAYVYDRIEVTVANASLMSFWEGATSIETACTKAVIFTGDPSIENLPKGDRFQSALVRLLESTDAATLRPEAGWLQSVMNTVANTSREAMQEAAQKAKEFAEKNKVNL